MRPGGLLWKKSGKPRLGQLQLWKPHTFSSLTLRVQVAQTARDDHLARFLRNCFSHTPIKTAEHEQVQDNFIDTPTPSFDSEETLVKWSPDAITSRQEDRIHNALSSGSLGPWNAKPPAPTRDSILGGQCPPQKSDSKKKENRRKSRAQKTSKHIEDKSYKNIQMRDKGWASYDWQTPLELLSERSPERYADPPTVRTYNPWRHPKIRQIRADRIPVPSVWSHYTFCLYIEELTRSSVDPLIQRQLYGKGGSHVAEVSRILWVTLKAPAAREFLSPKAFNLAIAFFLSKTAITQAVALFEYMEWLRMEVPAETMDIMLRSCALQKDLFTYTKILRKCTNRGIVPTASSWTALIQVVWSRDVQEVIIQCMRDRNMLENSSIKREVAKLTVREDIMEHLDKGLDPISFLDLMDARFGAGWLSVSAGNMILYGIGQRKPSAEAVSMLHVLMERGMNVNEATLNSLLEFCRRERDHLLAIRVLRLLHVEKGVRIDVKTLHLLFMQAWRSRLYNFARVIWRTACIRGLAAFNMRNLVKQNLLYHKSHVPNDKPTSRANIWSKSAGEVIVGIKPAHDLDNFLFLNPVTKATRSRSNAREKLIADDLATAGRYRLVDDLSELLTNALKLDRMWMESGAWKGESAEWKRKMGIAVRVVEIGYIPPRLRMVKTVPKFASLRWSY